MSNNKNSLSLNSDQLRRALHNRRVSDSLVVNRSMLEQFSTSAPPSSSANADKGFLAAQWQDNESLVFAQFMKAHKCYDLIPTSTKVVVFDTQLPVKKAFFALVYNGVRAAPLWDSTRQVFVGMLTITDFINILRQYYRSPAGISQELEDHKICTWKDVKKDDVVQKLICIDPQDSLYTAVQRLCQTKVHRLPVIDRATGNVLYILTHKRILRFLHLYIHDLPRPSYMEKTPKELGIGTWDNDKIRTVRDSVPLIDALNEFASRRVSALPVVNDHNKVVDIYSKFDVINLAAEKAYDNLDITVKDALKHRLDWFEGVQQCTAKDTLDHVIERIVNAEVHRLVITDDDGQVDGIISLSDLLFFLVLKPMDCTGCVKSADCRFRADDNSVDSVPMEI